MKLFKRILRMGNELSDYLRPMEIPLHSAHISFFLILSLFPSLLLLLGLLRYTDFGTADLLSLLEGFIPPSFLPIVEMLLDASYRHSSGTVVSVSVLATLWSASRGMYGLLGGLQAVYETAPRRGYLRTRSLSVVYNFLFLLSIACMLVLNMFGNSIMDYLRMTTVPALMLLTNLIDLRLVLLLLLQTLLFTAIYARLPGHRTPVKKCLPGALLASLGWVIYSKLFSIYVTYFSQYTNIFGSIYALALGMLWLYCCIGILLYGAALTRWLQEKTPDFFRK